MDSASLSPARAAEVNIEIKTLSDVGQDEALNRETITLINRAFAAVRGKDPKQWDLSKPRLLVDQPMNLAIGQGARIALVTWNGSLIATVAAVPMPQGPPRRPHSTANSNAPWFELKLASTDPSLQRKGYVSQAISALEEQLLLEVGGPISMFVEACASLTGDYWLRRGFTTIHTEEVPTGTWNSLRPFTIMTLVKSSTALPAAAV